MHLFEAVPFIRLLRHFNKMFPDFPTSTSNSLCFTVLTTTTAASSFLTKLLRGFLEEY